MNRSRILTLFLAFALWFSTTGFLPFSESQPSTALTVLPSSGNPAPLAAVTLGKISPGKAVSGIPASSVRLEWGAIQGYTGAVTYRYCIGTSKNCPKSKWVRVGTALSATVSNLKANTTYYWSVRAYNTQNVMIIEADGMPWTFTTLPLPGTFSKTGPVAPNNSLLDPANVVLQWNTNSTNATSYEYCVDTTNDQRCDSSVGWKAAAASGVTPAGLSLNAVYYWQVRAVNGSGTTLADWGTWWTFTTALNPGVFDKLSPLNTTANQPVSNFALSWMVSPNATSYRYCLSSTASTCTGVWQNVGNVTSYTLPTTLLYDTDYYWQVEAVALTGATPANGGAWWSFHTQPPLPGAFSKLTPAMNAQNLYTDVAFTWQASSGATGYEFCYYLINNEIDCTDGPWDSFTGTTTRVYGLEVGKTYYWQVRALNTTGTTDANSSTWWTFTTQPNPPLDFTKTTPTDGVTKQATSLILTWTPSSTPGATYQVCYDTSNNGDCELDNWRAATTSSTYSVSGLTPGVTYYWQVRATNAGGTTYADYDMATWWSFTTLYPAPAAFGKTSPASGAVDQPLNLSLAWEASSAGVTYEVCYDKTSGSICDGDAWQTVPAQNGTTYSLTGLDRAATYYWQVRAKNIDGTITEANAGVWRSFTTIPNPPEPFGKSAPTNTATMTAINPTLTWNASPSVGTSYEVCYVPFGAACQAADWKPVLGAGVTSFDVTGLNYGTKYYWQVRGSNAGGTTYADGAESAGWTFTTLLARPADFSKQAPGNDATNQPLDLTLTWDPSDSGVTYELCYDTSAGSACDGDAWLPVPAENGTSFHLTQLDRATTYYWQVRAKNSEGTITEANAAWWHFTTIPNPPDGFTKAAPGDGTKTLDTALTLSWNPSLTAGTSYEVCYVLSENTCQESDWHQVTPEMGTSYTPTGLLEGTTYYWQVRGSNAGGTTYANGLVDAGWTFTTRLPAPAAFEKSTPDGSSPQPLNLALTWTASDPDAAYEVCYIVAGETCEEADWQAVPEAQGLSFALMDQELDYAITYAWQVRAKNTEGRTTQADGGVWWTFTTMLPPPAGFSKFAPLDKDTSQSPELTLRWTVVDQDAAYEYCVSETDGQCPSEQDWKAAAGGSAAPAGLTYDKTYFWQVRAKNSEGTTTQANTGAWWRFTTHSMPPTGFVKLSPANNDTNRPLNLTLIWSSAGAGFTYEYCLTQTTPLSCETWQSVATTSVQPADLQHGKTYYWQVRAKDSSGHTTDANKGDENPVWTFSTLPVPPSSEDVTYPNVPEDQNVSGDLPGANQMFFALHNTNCEGDLNLSESGHFTYDPPQDYVGVITFQFMVTDHLNEPVGPYTVTIQYTAVNDPPVITAIEDVSIISGDTVQFTPTVTDPDVTPEMPLTFTITGLPAGATFDSTTGAFQWQAVWAPGAGNVHTITITVSDGYAMENPVQETLTITVLPRRIFLPIVVR